MRCDATWHPPDFLVDTLQYCMSYAVLPLVTSQHGLDLLRTRHTPFGGPVL